MDEILNPAHGISWSAIIFVAGGCYVLIRILDNQMKKMTRIVEQLQGAQARESSELDRAISDIKDISRSSSEMAYKLGEHTAWSGERHKHIDSMYVTMVDRISRLEGKIFNGKRD